MGKKGGVEAGSGKEKGGEGEVVSTAEFVPPDGGYGWVIVLVCGMANFFMLALIQNFGLIYKDIMKEWEMTTAEYSFIVNFQFSVSNFVGLITGPMLRSYGYRVVTFWGAILVGGSAVLTSQVNKFHFFVMTFSIIGGVGVGFGWSATALAVNTYFKRRRGIATGISWTATGLSPVLIPFFVTWLLDNYDVHGTVLLIAGMMLHNIPAALLMHPVQWHTKPVKATKTKVEGSPDTNQNEEVKVLMEEDKAKEALRHERVPMTPNFRSQGSGEFLVDTQGTIGLDVAAPISRHSSKWSIASTGELSKITSFSLERIAVENRARESAGALLEEPEESEVVTQEPPERKKSCFKRILSRIVDFYDLTLLSEPRFLLIFLGMTLAFGGEMNFTILTPFVLAEHGFPLRKIALFMSILASMDLVTRFTVPFLSDRYKFDCKLMYALGIMVLSLGRIMLVHLSGFYQILFVTLWCGFGKGLRTVYMALIMPSTVPLERLPAASGLNMTANGIMFILIGPVFGYIRDNSETFALAMYTINVMSFSSISVFVIEYFYTKSRNRREKKLKEQEKLTTKCT